jgi:hypothetical protein
MTFVEDAQTQGSVDRLVAALRRTSEGTGTVEETLDALEALHRLRELLAAWEPLLIEAAREAGASWARIAPALGVTSRQAAERRYLRLRPSQDSSLNREERVRAARDERAGDRAVAAWARDNASELRQIAGQASAAAGLSSAGRRHANALAGELTGDDPATLLEPLADLRDHLVGEHAELAERVDAVGRKVGRVRRETQRRRGAAASS